MPGAGLGRLCLDIARLGFRAEVRGLPIQPISASECAPALHANAHVAVCEEQQGAAEQLHLNSRSRVFLCAHR